MKPDENLPKDDWTLRAGDMTQYSRLVTDGPKVVGIEPLPAAPADHHEPLAPSSTPHVRGMDRPRRR